ncbi:MAG: acyl-[acyl-carrier-protein]--UDP-N-acetylglucosamine O-acyltransferase, partial [Bacteroidota bacterium]
SVVLKDVPPFVTAARDPLSYAGINTIGLKRRNFSSDEMRVIEDVYRILFVKGYAVSRALNIIEDELPESEYRTRIVDFVKGATRGLMKGFRSK